MRKLCRDQEIRFLPLNRLLPTPGRKPYSQTSWCSRTPDHAGCVHHPRFQQRFAREIRDEVAGEDQEVAGDDGLDLGEAEDFGCACVLGETLGSKDVCLRKRERCEMWVSRKSVLDGFA